MLPRALVWTWIITLGVAMSSQAGDGKVRLEQRLGAPLPMDVSVRDASEESHQLSDYLNGKPVVLLFGYNRCETLCGSQVKGLARACRVIKQEAPEDYQVWFFSIDPKEPASLAKEQEEAHPQGWRFLRASQGAINRLTDAAGYHFTHEPKTDVFAHPSGVLILTPEGLISQVFYGLEPPSGELEEALDRAKGGEQGEAVTEVLLRCFAYNPEATGAGRIIFPLLRTGAVLTILFLGFYVFRSLKREKGNMGMALFPFLAFLNPPQASADARSVDWLFGSMLVVSALVILLLFGLMAFAVFRGLDVNKGWGKRLASNHLGWEAGWSLATLVGFLVFFGFGADLYFRLYRLPAEGKEINIVGRQWMWQSYYDNGVMQHDTLMLKQGEPVRLILTSEDVIHSFYAPAFRVKHDVVPGKYVSIGFTPEKVGDFKLLCAEYCGAEHANMKGWIHVLSPEKYEDWVNRQAAGDSLAAQGRKLYFEHGCSACHEPNEVVAAPSLKNLYGRTVALTGGGSVKASREYLHDSLIKPAQEIVAGYQNVMPSYKDLLSDGDIIALTAYIQSLSDNE